MRRRIAFCWSGVVLGCCVLWGWTALRPCGPAAAADSPASASPAATSPTSEDSAAASSAGSLTPEQALAAFRLEPGLRIELVAAEPLVVSPVALTFDARGRMFVAENRGYPSAADTEGRIALLEDTDSDGRFDKRNEFAEGLSFPNGLMPWRDGLIVTCAPDVLFLQDTDGDGRADRREVLFTGFSTSGSTQLRASHPTLGIDNWIYISGGLTGGKVTAPGYPEHPVVEIQRADFRFRPDSGQFEMADGGAQFGLTFDDFGRRFICYNRVQVQHVVLPSRYLRRNKNLAFSATVQDCPADMQAEQLRGHGAAARLYPISSNITTADSHAGTFTAACGLTIFRGAGLPAEYRGGAFSCDPTGNLVHFDRLAPAGATFSASRFPSEIEFLASTDNWFRPVNLTGGPDGALYVCDMYRKTIEHPDYLPAEVRRHTDFEGGKGMGRIYRVVRSNLDARQLGAERTAALAVETTAQLCRALGASSGWSRDTAQRRLLERRDPAAVPLLRAIVLSPSEPASAAAHALRLLEALGAIDKDVLMAALGHQSAGVRENGLEVAEGRLAEMPGLLDRVLALADDSDARVRFQCALVLGASSDPRATLALARIAGDGAQDRWARAAVLCSVGGREIDFLDKLLAQPFAPTPAYVELLGELGQLIGAAVSAEDRAAAIKTIVAAVETRTFEEQAALVAGFAESLRLSHAGGAAGTGLQSDLGERLDPASAEAKFFQALFRGALKTAKDGRQSPERRSVALSVLADADSQTVGEALLALVSPGQPISVQSGAARALKCLGDAALAGRLLAADRFGSFSPPLREEVISAMFSQPQFLPELLGAIESGAVPVGVVDSLRRSQLTGHRDPAIRERAVKLLASSMVGDRAKVYEEYKSALALAPSATSGRQVFLKLCANCHRLDRAGTPVGPDLFGIRNQPKEAILLHILIPEYEITPGFAAYVVETTDGRVLSGLLVAETPTRVTLRQALNKEETVLRSDIESLTLSKLSLMPQELEKTLSKQDVADLLSYLKGEQQ